MFDEKEYNKKYYQKNKERFKEYNLKNKELIALKMKEYRKKNKERIKEYQLKNKDKIQEWRRNQRIINKEKIKKYYQDNKERIKQQHREYNRKNNDKKREYDRKRKYNNKIRIYNHYSNYDIKCNCCGDRHIEFLTLDHINNDGNVHRRIIGVDLHRWVIKNNFPPIFQVLCMNCNFAKGKVSNPDKICPHQIKKAQEILNHVN